ncbi:MAG: FAD-dependent oxidoreductase [Candidatus Jordarchaeum sp.]|uniref:FAD-dependent oxidoreductase n=1 Tax=Candidatus Jordarchaeum sp. TaxID=2823881 RepID=UPI00404AC0AF
MEKNNEEIVGSVLVIGGGIAGIQASLDLTDLGYKVYLVEKSPSIGGRMAQLDKTFPTNDCSLCILAPKMVEVGRNPNVELLTYSEVKSVSGKAGNFKVQVLRKPRYVDETKCKACGTCSEKCPRKVDDEYNMGLGQIKAIYTPFAQAVPNTYVINPDECIYFQRGKCRTCEKFCPAGAIDFEQKERIEEINVGAIIVATGFDQFDLTQKKEYGYGRFPNAISALEFERLMCASGPTGGHIVRLSDHKEPEKIAWIQCVGSRDTKVKPYCSSVCCMYATKEAIITKEHDPNMDCYIFYIDMRAFGKGFQDFVNRAQEEYHVKYIRGKVSQIIEDPKTKNLKLRFEDMEKMEFGEMEVGLVVLSPALVPSKGTKELAEILGLNLDENCFIKEKDEFSPVETNIPGIYICGYVQGPKDIPESVAQASAAAAKASELLAPARGTLLKGKKRVPEKKISEEPRIGVMICHCGTNIGGFLDCESVAEYAKTLPGVVYAEDNMYSCSSDTQEKIKLLIADYDLNRFVVASCTPRTHEPLFMKTCEEAGLNPFLFEMANIRDQCSWVHMREYEKATEKAKDLVRMAVEKARMLEPLYCETVEVERSALVIGGGIAGINAALSIAKQGFKVNLIEKEKELGGKLRSLDTLFLSGKKAEELLQEKIDEISRQENITVYTGAKVKGIEGYIGNFKVTIENEEGEKEIKVGVIVVAVGAESFKPFGMYNYGNSDRILTLLELEEKMKKGSFDPGKNIVFVQCVGSREPEGRTYCSRVCCSTSIKQALKLKEHDPERNIFILYRDIVTPGKEYEDYYRKAMEKGILFIRYLEDQKPEVTLSKEGKPIVEVYDPLLQKIVEIDADNIVLATPMVPIEDNEELSSMLKVPLSQHGFFLEAHVKLRPLDFATDGIFLCGAASTPSTIPEAIDQAEGAASRASTILAKGEVETVGISSVVDEELCIGCGRCAAVCPYNAIQMITCEEQLGEMKIQTRKAQVIEAVCKGCGTCVSECGTNAINQKRFERRQILKMIESVIQ